MLSIQEPFSVFVEISKFGLFNSLQLYRELLETENVGCSRSPCSSSAHNAYRGTNRHIAFTLSQSKMGRDERENREIRGLLFRLTWGLDNHDSRYSVSVIAASVSAGL